MKWDRAGQLPRSCEGALQGEGPFVSGIPERRTSVCPLGKKCHLSLHASGTVEEVGALCGSHKSSQAGVGEARGSRRQRSSGNPFQEHENHFSAGVTRLRQ